jgi:hypothetical protein
MAGKKLVVCPKCHGFANNIPNPCPLCLNIRFVTEEEAHAYNVGANIKEGSDDGGCLFVLIILAWVAGGSSSSWDYWDYEEICVAVRHRRINRKKESLAGWQPRLLWQTGAGKDVL